VLFSVAGLSLGAMGYHGGLLRTSRSFAIIAVGLSFTAVIGLIADLDRPTEGVLKVSQQALIDVRQSMKPPGAP
jgi:predicted membrane protein